jgi:hypothetical protein
LDLFVSRPESPQEPKANARYKIDANTNLNLTPHAGKTASGTGAQGAADAAQSANHDAARQLVAAVRANLSRGQKLDREGRRVGGAGRDEAPTGKLAIAIPCAEEGGSGTKRDQEGENRPNVPLQETFRRGILRGPRNIPDAP